MTTIVPIRQTLFSTAGQATLADMPSPNTFSGRMEFARAVCQKFHFVDSVGNWRISSCIAVLRDLEAAGRIQLPPRTASTSGPSRPKMQAASVPHATDVPDRVDKISGFSVQRVDTKVDAQLLARLLHDEHPQGAAQHSGRQLRYVITSDHGVLGGFVFASPALTLKPRDRWIGWNTEQRRLQLSRVLGMSRFLIRPHIACQHLASKAIGHCLRRVPTDFVARYKIVPLLCETFSGAAYYGTSLAASGWLWLGRTAGRGRYSLPGQTTERKGIWLRPLYPDWRAQLGVPEPDFTPPLRPKQVLDPGEGLAMDVWANNEFGAVPLNKALVKRLIKSVKIQAKAPAKAFFSAANGDDAAVKGYYRMIERPDTGTFTPDAILTAHRERSLCRIRGAKTALLIQDGSDLNFVTHGACEGSSVISRTTGSKGTLNIHMQSTFAVNEDGVPLGVPRIEFDYPNGQAEKDKAPEERASARWLRGWRDSSELAAKASGTRVISVMDREGNIAALFAERHAKGGAELLVRAKHDRVFSDSQTLFDRLRTSPPQAAHKIRVDRASARRFAHTQVRWHVMNLRVPQRERGRLGKEPFPLTAVHVIEPNPPANAEPVEWLLLTTLPIMRPSEAIEVLDFYAFRWRSEDWYRILKNGCEVEKIAHSTAARITRAMTINAVIAWRLSVLTRLGHATPEISASHMLDDAEIACRTTWRLPSSQK